MSLVLRTPVGGQTIDSEGAAATTSPRVFTVTVMVWWYGTIPLWYGMLALWYGMVVPPPYHHIIAYCLLWYG